MTTRSAEHRDVTAIVALESGVFGAEAWSEAQVADELSMPSHTVVVAERDGAVVGYGAIAVAAEIADLLRIAVAPESRRSGVASAVLRSLHDRATGAERMLLEVASSNAGAQAFYAAHGYVEIACRRRYYANGDDAVIMAHPLG
jgi:ribosomal-protein-alanine N-acetyltransferase